MDPSSRIETVPFAVAFAPPSEILAFHLPAAVTDSWTLATSASAPSKMNNAYLGFVSVFGIFATESVNVTDASPLAFRAVTVTV